MGRFNCLLVFIGVIASACRPGTPSESSGEAELRQRIDSGKADRLRLVSFRKTDGQLIEAFGMKGYKMDFTAEVEFVRDALYSTGGGFLPMPAKAITTAELPASQNYWQQYGNLIQRNRSACRGDRLMLNGSLEFILKESGWQSDDAGMAVSLDSANRKSNCLARGVTPMQRSAANAATVRIPPRTGLLNDFAGIVPSDRQSTIAKQLTAWSNAHESQIVVVTLADIGNADPVNVVSAVRREWKLEASGRNVAFIVLVTPKETAVDNRGHVRLDVGSGRESINAAMDSIVDQALPALRSRDYSGGIEHIIAALAERLDRRK